MGTRMPGDAGFGSVTSKCWVPASAESSRHSTGWLPTSTAVGTHSAGSVNSTSKTGLFKLSSDAANCSCNPVEETSSAVKRSARTSRSLASTRKTRENCSFQAS